ncbi:YbfB/YjiJ family MFS transporter [Geobacter sp. DSM 9736]|uniref:YbfB/YjiJ family MFS transporter n=1 Tax=Geobacter sp. DSM 9736 TaxID=1277350 RepID=UPI000B5E02C1|nr:YbfB/YjiJ family MFS transporter [Geobacter sp. DSM 9736]SNB45627.1 Sugar phosphate permease [Geobacter sp. DSM 9736]
MRKQSLHYGWIIVITGFFVLFSCLGLARYAYTMLLPAMQEGLGLSYDRMGFIGTANFVGYLLAVILSPHLIRRLRPRALVGAGLFIIAVAMGGIAASQGFASIVVLYTLAGMGGGFANIPMMALVTYWFHSEKRGRAAGLVIAGNGAAIIFAGFVVPRLTALFGLEGWRYGWSLLALITLCITGFAAALLRNDPAEKGLEPLGHPPRVSPSELIPHDRRQNARMMLRLGILYLIFGATFMVFGTFIVATMVREFGFSQEKAGLYWSWVGFFSVFSGVGFGALSDRIGRKRGLALVFIVQTVAYVMAGLKLGGIVLAVSVVLYGLAVFAIPAIMAAAVGDYLGLARAASAFATVTLFFAFGQTIGPATAGIIARITGTFTTAYLIAAALTATGAVLALTLPSTNKT